MNTLVERIERGRRAISLAKAQGRDTTAWEKRLAELQGQNSPPMPPIPPPPADPQAEAEEIARRVMEHGICLIWADTVQDFLAFVRDDFDHRKVPPGFVIYTDAELKELFGKGQRHNPATLRLIHEAKRSGGKIANER